MFSWPDIVYVGGEGWVADLDIHGDSTFLPKTKAQRKQDLLFTVDKI